MHGNIVEHLAAKMTKIVLCWWREKKIELEENECCIYSQVNTNTTSNEY